VEDHSQSHGGDKDPSIDTAGAEWCQQLTCQSTGASWWFQLMTPHVDHQFNGMGN